MEHSATARLGGRAASARRGKQLEAFTILWASIEAGVALYAATKDHSISLAGFGFDSVIEVVSAIALLWRMSHEMNHHRRHQAEAVSLRIAGVCLLALAVYISCDAGLDWCTGIGLKQAGWVSASLRWHCSSPLCWHEPSVRSGGRSPVKP
jgi:hypothetical protein